MGMESVGKDIDGNEKGKNCPQDIMKVAAPRAVGIVQMD